MTEIRNSKLEIRTEEGRYTPVWAPSCSRLRFRVSSFGFRVSAFTLLELLAAVTLMVILGTMLFQVFDQASRVTRIGTARQEVFQYVHVLFNALERELSGPIANRDASIYMATSQGLSRPFRVYHTPGARKAFTGGNMMFASRDGSDVLSFTAALIGRDTVPDSVTYGQTANCAYVCYWLSPPDCASCEPFALNRYESYDIQAGSMLNGGGGEFALNVLDFNVTCLDPWASPPGFRPMDWESASIGPTGGRRGLPLAVEIVLRITDSDHISCWRLDAPTGRSVLKSGLTPDDDPIAQQFRLVVTLPGSH
jgi:type II secretory pathway pseudopilin PulG